MPRTKRRCDYCDWILIFSIPQRMWFAISVRMWYLMGGDIRPRYEEVFSRPWEYISPCFWFEDTAIEHER